MSRTHQEMREAANDVLMNYDLRDDLRVTSRASKDAFYEVAAGVLAECVIALIAEIELLKGQHENPSAIETDHRYHVSNQ